MFEAVILWIYRCYTAVAIEELAPFCIPSSYKGGQVTNPIIVVKMSC